MKRTPLRRSGPIGRRKPLRKVNRARQKKRKAANFGAQAALCRTLPCCACGLEPTDETPTHPHHVRSRAAGGGDASCVPLCHAEHVEGHQIGWKTFEKRKGVDLQAVADELAQRLRDEA